MMDRPLGPRQPDKRLAAYETIFGRPGVSHHLSSGPSPPPQNYPPTSNYSQSQYSYPSNQPRYSSPNNPYSSLPYSTQPPDPRQSFYASPPPPSQNQSWSHPNYPYLQPPYPYPQQSLTPLVNNQLSLPVYPQSDDPSDPIFNSPSRHPSLSHPYQSQPYHNTPIVHQQPSWGHLPQQQQQPLYEYEQDLRYQNGSASRSLNNIPHLGVNIDATNGRLDLRFDEESSSSPSDTDDSELPWANAHSCTSFFFKFQTT